VRERILFFLTGPTGVGKSTVAEIIASTCTQQGLRCNFINDYPILEDWAKRNRSNSDKVIWKMPAAGGVEFFSIQEKSYQEASVFIASAVAQHVCNSLKMYDVNIMEAARGAGEPRDRYGEHLFKPFVEKLSGLVRFANIQMTVENLDDLRTRVVERYARDPTSAPPFVLEKYLPILSSVSDAAEFGDQFKFNGTVNNSDVPNQVKGRLASIVTQILAGGVPV